MPRCAKCGGIVAEGDEFCTNCGAGMSPAVGNHATPAPAPSPSHISSVQSPVAYRRGYSKKTRLLGLASTAVLIIAILVSAAGWYSIATSVVQTGTALGSRAQSGVPGSGLIENTTTGEVLVLPITNGGVFPISVSVDGALLDSQNVSLLSIESSVTVNPHQTQTMVIQISTSVYQELIKANSTGVSSGTFQGRLQVTTLDGLLGARLSLSLHITPSNATGGGLTP